ncbi:hypothetical protein [Geomicrobium sp. JCM 19037]|uniref:hypothetical protein n=1 Tax=Geomicrobium sp. JCM 19037 TaxID=1460634 RepID=UPI0006946029|nr:hypothetical protein [Geomicrobium sp. JCM 19037]
MPKKSLNLLFKSQQKDDKKEVLKFELHGDEENTNDLHLLAGEMVNFEINNCDAGMTTAEFVSIQKDSKKTVLKFAIKGDSDEKARQLYAFAGHDVTLIIEPAQTSLEDFEPPHEASNIACLKTELPRLKRKMMAMSRHR